jgi:phage baseplate assembly protein W
MAYVIGKQIQKDSNPELQSSAYGIKLPAKLGNTGYFDQAFTTYEQAKSNLRNLLATKKGERIMQPEFGTGLHSLLFEQLDTNLEQDLQNVITQTVSFWLPYINIEEIDVRMTDEMKDMNRAEMSITFSVANQIDLQTVSFTIRG